MGWAATAFKAATGWAGAHMLLMKFIGGAIVVGGLVTGIVVWDSNRIAAAEERGRLLCEAAVAKRDLEATTTALTKVEKWLKDNTATDEAAKIEDKDLGDELSAIQRGLANFRTEMRNALPELAADCRNADSVRGEQTNRALAPN